MNTKSQAEEGQLLVRISRYQDNQDAYVNLVCLANNPDKMFEIGDDEIMVDVSRSMQSGRDIVRVVRNERARAMLAPTVSMRARATGSGKWKNGMLLVAPIVNQDDLRRMTNEEISEHFMIPRARRRS